MNKSNSICLPCEAANKALKKVSNIGEAWINVVIKDPVVEALAIDRLKVCDTCLSRIEFMKINNKPIFKCKECGCPLIALVRSNESCKLGKW